MKKRKQLKLPSQETIVGWGGKISSLLLLLMGLYILSPALMEQTSAEGIECKPGDTNPLCSTAYTERSEVGVQVASAISIAMQNRTEVEVVPKSSGNAFSASGVAVTVATNNPEGYALYMKAGEVTDGEAKLTSGMQGITATIDPVPGTATQEAMESNPAYANKWGYSTDGRNYQAVPADNLEIKKVTTTSYHDTHNLDFGVAVNTSLPAGYYSNSVIVSAVANPLTLTLSNLTYMQEMEAPICAKTAVGTTKQLIDLRDGKKYWVAKLADNNCWMTQNLALDLSTDTPLVPETSDVATSWTPPSNTETVAPKANGNPAGYVSAVSWSFGDYALIAPASLRTCHTPKPEGVSSPMEDGTAMAAWAGQNLDGRCTSYLQSVTDWTANFTAQDGTWEDYTGLISINPDDKTYDAHYLLGNYYQWSAAIADEHRTINDDHIAPQSICPKGWQLPLAEARYNNASGSFYNLLKEYGLANAVSGTGADGKTYNIAAAPLYITYTGGVDIWSGVLQYIGIRNVLYSRYGYSNVGAGLYVTSSGGAMQVSPNATTVGWWLGNSVRCVAR